MVFALQKETEIIVKDLLGPDFIELNAQKLQVEESFSEERVRICCHLTTQDQQKLEIQGEGVGLIDALMNALMAKLTLEYPSLKQIKLSDFSIKTDLSTQKLKTGSDSLAIVELTVENMDRKRFVFKHQSRSITRSSACVVLSACSYFANSERAFIKARQALKRAQKDKRPDSVERCTHLLTQLVENASYQDLIIEAA